jgi:cysteine desulfurase
MKVYLDNGATTKVAKEVVEAMNEFNSEKYGNASSLHSFGNEASEALSEARKKIAEFLGCSGEEIIFTSGGSESDNLAIKGVAYLKKEGHIITSKIEHPAVLETCKFLEKKGFEVSYLNVDDEGFVSLEELEKEIKKDTILVSIMHANNEIGTIQDIDKIGEVCKKKGVLFHTDAVQSFGKVDIDLENIDLLSISSHKIHGPKGVGALYIKKGVRLEKQVHGGGHEFNLRAGTENVAGIVGFGKAVELIDNGRMLELRDKLVEKVLDEISDVKLNGSKDRLCNNANFSFKFVEGEALVLRLDSEGIAVSTGSACSTHSLEPSHVLLAIGIKREDSHGSLRLTLSRYTTEKEIDYCVDKLKKIIKELREISPFKNV